MKKLRKILCIILAVLCVVTASGCRTAQPLETKISLNETTVTTQPPETTTTAPTNGEISKIIFSEKFLNVAEMSPEEWVDDLIATGDGQYVDVYINEDGVSVTLEITEEQREYWITSYEGFFATLQQKFAAINPNYKIECSEDYTHYDISFNLDLDFYDATYYIIYAEVICAGLQVITGVPAEEWYVSCTIYNCDTGKTVANGDSETGLSYKGEDWIQSYSEE